MTEPTEPFVPLETSATTGAPERQAAAPAAPPAGGAAEPAESNAQRCATVVVAALVEAGVGEAVLSPGSRSAPLAYALEGAHRAGSLRLHVRLDERTAGFLALGLAKASGRPVPVITTSGTAAANLHPAVLEAAHAGVPILAVTADRPRRLVHTGANQTTDQIGLFGTAVRGSVELDDRDPGRAIAFQVRRLLALAAGTRTRHPGPVQLDVQFDDPLAPRALSPTTSPRSADRVDLAIAQHTPNATPPAPARAAAGDSIGTRTSAALPAGPRTVIVAGDGDPARGVEIARLAAGARLPLIAEPSSNARCGEAALALGRLLASGPLAREIERVIVLGHPTLSRPVGALLGRSGVEVVVVTDRADWAVPGWPAAAVHDSVDLAPDRTDWLERWVRADQAVGARLRGLIDEQSAGLMSGWTLAAELWAALPPGAVLVAGSSNPIRDLDLVPIRRDPPVTYANRGLAGIDGTISTALGVALAHGGPVHALVGDLTFLHDLTGLLLPTGEARPDLRIVVADDDGGSIFATLEHGEPGLEPAYERLFGTPHRRDLVAVATALGATATRISQASDLRSICRQPPRGVEVVVATVDRRRRRTLDASIRDLIASPQP